MKTTHLKQITFILAFALLACVARAQTGWTNLYTGAGGSASASAVAVDSSGNVFVTGYSYDASNNQDYATIKYSNAGVPLWTNLYTDASGLAGASAIAVDGSGNAFVTGSTGLGAVTIKYSNAGAPLWTNLYIDTIHGGGAWGDTIAVDTNGNVLVTGGAGDNAYLADLYWVIIKYSNAGVPLWTNLYTSFVSSPSGSALDSNGNVFVTGPDYYSSYVTIKYSNTGVPMWTNLYTGPSGGYASAIALDGSGNVFVTGVSYDASNNPNYASIKYSNAGVPLWTNLYTEAGSYQSDSRLAVDGNGNVFVSGTDSNSDNVTIKYSNAGVPLWTNLYNLNTGQGAYFSVPAIVVDGNGNVFVTRQSYDGTNYFTATFKYSNAGVPLWTNLYTGAGGDANPSGVAVDGSGNAFVTGQSYDGTNYDYATIEYPNVTVPPVAYLQGQRLNQQLVLSWTNAGFSLQSAPVVTGTFTNIPGATSPYTNAASLTQQFFRLMQ